MSGAGHLNRRIRFDRRSDVPSGDGLGNFDGAWQAQFTVAAEVKALRGGESVLGARLTGTQPVVIIVRLSPQTLTIRSDWRAVDTVSGTEYAITAPPADTAGRRKYLDIMATSGVAQ